MIGHGGKRARSTQTGLSLLVRKQRLDPLLRLAVGVLALLFLVIYIRSYWKADFVEFRLNRTLVEFGSSNGRVRLLHATPDP